MFEQEDLEGYVGREVCLLFGTEESYDEIADAMLIRTTKNAIHLFINEAVTEWDEAEGKYKETGERVKCHQAIPLSRILEIRYYEED